jgi:N-acetylglucosamine kinase-like BadF-type ATPase
MPIQFTKPLGYILGDEGSGTRMGISFLKAYLRGEFDNETLEFFAEKIQLTNEEILERIYKGNNAKEFLASFLPLMAMKTGSEQISNIILHSFHEFIHSFILKIPGHLHLPVGFCGSPAVYFSSILDEALAKHNLVAYKTIREPIHGLIKYQSLLDKLF